MTTEKVRLEHKISKLGSSNIIEQVPGMVIITSKKEKGFRSSYI